jgi:hypothetical protein
VEPLLIHGFLPSFRPYGTTQAMISLLLRFGHVFRTLPGDQTGHGDLWIKFIDIFRSLEEADPWDERY